MAASSASELAQLLASELSKECSAVLERSIGIHVQDSWVLGTLLHLYVDKSEQDDMIDCFIDVIARSSCSHAFWVDEDTIWVRAGLDAYRSTRLDRYAGSRVYTMTNSAPIDSVNRLQLIKIEFHDSPGDNCSGMYLANIDQQRMAVFLTTSLRLSPQDASVVVDVFDANQLSWDQIREIGGDGFNEMANSLYGINRSIVTRSVAALHHPHENDYFKALLSALSDSQVLETLSNKVNLSAASRFLARKFVIGIVLHHSTWNETAPRRSPSFFVEWPKDITCDAHIHVVDNIVATRRFSHLLTFQARPSGQMI